MEAKITMSIGALIGIIAAVAGPITTALVYMYKQREGTQRELVNLTKTFIEDNMRAKLVIEKTLENNTNALNEVRTVIKELPEQINLHVAARKQ